MQFTALARFFYLTFLCIASSTLDSQAKDSTVTNPSAKIKPPTSPSQNATPPVVQQQKQNPTTPAKPVEVIEVYNKKYENDEKKKHTASIGDLIVIKVSNVDSLRRRSKCKDAEDKDLPPGICKPQQIRLFINGRMVVGIEPEKGEPERLANGEGAFHFRIERNEQNDKIWADILGSPLFNKDFFVVPVKISVGLENDYPLVAKDDDASLFNFERIHMWWFWLSLIVIIIMIFGIITLAKKGLLRDRIIDLRDTELWNPDPTATNRLFAQPPTPPYSLGRSQMAFWFVFVIVSFLFIWLITDAYNILNASVLALIGISAGTSISAAIIDDNKKNGLIAETKILQDTYDNPLTPANEKQQALDKMKGNIKQLETEPSKGFLKDILEDANGISFHRWQMLVWTIVLGLLFLYTVWKRLSMPDFDAAMLALQGITSGTYLGFKFPERPN